MTNLTDDLLIRAVIAERKQKAKAMLRAAEAAGEPRALRATFAARLARLVLRVARGAARFWLSRETGTPAANARHPVRER